ncbi:MAG: DUF4178 domain-containing protein [Pseudomonadota bacterium]
MSAAAFAAAPDVRSLDCPSCGGAIELRAAGYSTLYVCQYCGSEIDLTGDDAKLIAEHTQAAQALTIPLGTKGTLDGITWIAIGHLHKNDGWEDWEEYCLFNPYHGYRWLVFTSSGWSLGTPMLSQPASPGDQRFRYDGATMRRCYDPASAKVVGALGEFYWQVKRGDLVKSTSYIGGGMVLSCEITTDEYNWTREDYISSADVAEAFGVEDTGEYPEIGDLPSPHQPNPYSSDAKTFALLASIAFFVGVLMTILLDFGGETRAQQFQANPSSTNRTLSLGRFEIKDRAKPFTITARGEPGRNNWMYVEYILTNVETDEEIIASQPIEYYTGSDWTEDDRRGTVKIASVPPGTYELTAEVGLPEDEARTNPNTSWSGGFGSTRPVAIEARANGTFYSSLFLLGLGLFAPVIWLGLRVMSFEGNRRSDFDGWGTDDDD